MKLLEEHHYSKHLLREGDVAVIHTDAGMAFLRVTKGPDVIPLEFPQDSTSAWGYLDPQSGTSRYYSVVIDNYDALEIWDARPIVIYQVFQAWYTPKQLVFWRFPKNTAMKYLRSEIGAADFDSSTRATHGWMLQSDESPLDFPTVAGEFFCVFKESPEFAVWNDASTRVFPKVRLLINKLITVPLNPEKERHLEKIKNIILGKYQKGVRRWSPGTSIWEYSLFQQAFMVQPVRTDYDYIYVGDRKIPL